MISKRYQNRAARNSATARRPLRVAVFIVGEGEDERDSGSENQTILILKYILHGG
jgi:hypothetical protein